MFVLPRSGFRLTRHFYIWVFAIGCLVTGGAASIGALLTMHVHFDPRPVRRQVPEKPLKKKGLDPAAIPDCDLPALPDRAGPHVYKGHPYYSYPDGTVDGFAQPRWWRLSLDEFKGHIDRIAST
jgi:hypothetical protein